MRKPFKKGDIITRIASPETTSVTIGKSYIVSEDESNSKCVYLMNDFGRMVLYDAYNFEISKHNIVKQIINDL